MKKSRKIAISGLTLAVVVATLVGVSTSWTSVNLITLGGSNSVLPLTTSLGNIYKDADVVTQGGGSGAGINDALEGTKDIGMASREPGIDLNQKDLQIKIDNITQQLQNPNITNDEKLDLNNQLKALQNSQKWSDKKIKTVTIAWDGIAVLYKPSNLTSTKELILTSENVAKIYTAFSGAKTLKLSDLGLDDESKIIPYARSGGSNVSGTAEAFEKSSGRDWKNSNYYNSLSESEKSSISNALKNGSYLSDNIIQTSEANSQAWSIAKNGAVGSVVYLSAGFVNNNKASIEKAGYKIATYEEGVFPTSETISKTYGWFRPFNLMLPTNSASSNLNFISWILDLNNTPGVKDTKQEEEIEKLGYILLSKNQILSMSQGETEQIKKENFWKLDDENLNRSGADSKA